MLLHLSGVLGGDGVSSLSSYSPSCDMISYLPRVAADLNVTVPTTTLSWK